MAEQTLLRESPLTHLAAAMVSGSSGAVALREEPFAAMVALAGPAGDTGLGFAVPQTVGETTSLGDHTALWLGPTEFLLICPTEAPAELLAKVRWTGSAVDVSANRTTLLLSGAKARAVLETGCSVDLHPRSFHPGRAITTSLAGVSLVLWQSGPESYRLLPRSSYAAHVARWLLDAMAEHKD